MELPDLGKHCSETTCKQLDFLPMKCDSCHSIFCNEHIYYNQHNCPESYKKDNQVPVCPLCNKPIPISKSQSADVEVGRHIDTDCQSDPAKERRKIYTNKCSHKGCKVKELIPVRCDRCQKNYCLKHRLEQDHACKGFQGSGSGVSRAGAAAAGRVSNPSKPVNHPKQTTMSNYMGSDLNRERLQRQQQQRGPGNMQSLQGNMSEDEALARAMAMSMQDSQQPTGNAPPAAANQEEMDRMLAQALAASEQEAATNQRRTRNRQQEKSCNVS